MICPRDESRTVTSKNGADYLRIIIITLFKYKRGEYNESESIGKKALQSMQDDKTQRCVACYLHQSETQTATGIKVNAKVY